jgi:hypothetical protein
VHLGQSSPWWNVGDGQCGVTAGQISVTAGLPCERRGGQRDQRWPLNVSSEQQRLRVAGSRRCGQSGQGATPPRSDRDGLGRPTRGSARAWGAARHGNTEHDDAVTAHTRGNQPRTCGARILKL